MAKLIIYEDLETPNAVFETFNLSENRILIGSDHENQLILDSPDIESTHASLELRENHWFLQDLGGPGGTIVNNHLIEGPYMLHHKDVIELGVIKMRFYNVDRGTTKEFPQATPSANVAGAEPEPEATDQEVYVSGRVWFAGLAGGTLIVILAVLSLLVAGHIFGIIDMFDLMPPGF